MLAAALLALAFAYAPADAQQSRAASGLVINIGIVPAEVALRADGHRDSHPTNPPPESQHLQTALDERKASKRIGDAEVAIEVIGPRRHVDKKPRLHTQAAGLADHSEPFVFPSQGTHTVGVSITRPPSAKPIEMRFTVQHTA